MDPSPLLAGAAEAPVTPAGPAFLYGYPHVERYSTGVHDLLLASALWLDDGQQRVLFVATDVIFLPRPLVLRARARIAAAANIDPTHVMLTASHTHSGPITTKILSNEADPVVPAPDPAFLTLLEDSMVTAATSAAATAKPARLSFALADGSGLGGNRRDPAGPAIPQMPVVAVRDARSDAMIALMVVCSMHPTVLHEDSTLISGDFPGLARQYLQQHPLARGCPFVYHMGAAGNQSPRHVTRSNTFEEAARLGQVLAHAVEQAVATARSLPPRLAVMHAAVDLPRRQPPAVSAAKQRVDEARERLNTLRAQQAPRPTVRTAECDWFGAEETLTLARAAAEGRLQDAARACMPTEVQLMQIGDVQFLGWPGEVFVEFALEVKASNRDTHVITLANGDLQGYLVTQQAVDERAYEANNAIFASPASGRQLVRVSMELLQAMRDKGPTCPSS